MGRRHWIAGIIGVGIIGLTLPQTLAQSQALSAPVVENPQIEESEAEVDSLPAEIPALQGDRIDHWAALGIRFEGPWPADRADLVVSVLDRFAEAIGDERFVTLIGQALAWGSDGQVDVLTFAMDPTHEHWAASWSPSQGRITLYGKLFDQDHMDAHYRWRFLDDLADAQPVPVSIQEITIGHELGHLLLDALRDTHTANGLADTLLEDTYGEAVYRDYWANPMQNTNESVASEIGLWVYGIRRPQQMQSYRTEILGPALLGQTNTVTPDTIQ